MNSMEHALNVGNHCAGVVVAVINVKIIGRNKHGTKGSN
jgi:hypothetical protein